jgi:hypothetical protein
VRTVDPFACECRARGLLEASLHGSRVVRREPAGESGVDAKDDPRELTGLGPECIFSEKVEAGGTCRGHRESAFAGGQRRHHESRGARSTAGSLCNPIATQEPMLKQPAPPSDAKLLRDWSRRSGWTSGIASSPASASVSPSGLRTAFAGRCSRARREGAESGHAGPRSCPRKRGRPRSGDVRRPRPDLPREARLAEKAHRA